MVNTTPGPKFYFFHEWRDDQGRNWAEPHGYQNASDARRSHVAASEFHWVVGRMRDPYISGLYARDASGVVLIQQPCGPGESPTRSPEVHSTVGAGKVSSVVKAEVQRRDPGSTPGGSTALPF